MHGSQPKKRRFYFLSILAGGINKSPLFLKKLIIVNLRPEMYNMRTAFKVKENFICQ